MKKTTKAMTNDERIAKMQALEATLMTTVEKINETDDKSTADSLKADLAEAKKEYAQLAAAQFRADCIAANPENPIFEACKRFKYTVFAIQSESLDSGDVILRCVPAQREVNLSDFGKPYTNGWKYRAELLCHFYTKSLAIGLGKTAEEVEKDITAFFKVSKEAQANPIPSRTSIQKIIEGCVSSMLGEEYAQKVVKGHTRYFVECFTQQGKDILSVRSAGVKQTINILTHICKAIIDHIEVATLESKSVKKDS